jgi:hypothetical protein
MGLGGEDHWSAVAFMIPPVPPSKLIFCTIMDIEYNLEVGGSTNYE